MNIKKTLQEFNKRWSVIEDSSYQEEFKKFRTRVLNIFGEIDAYVEEDGISQFCQILGIAELWMPGTLTPRHSSSNIIRALVRETDEKKFYYLLQIISFLPIRMSQPPHYREQRAFFFDRLAEAIELSNINLSMMVKKNEIIFYPKGEEQFDRALVEDVLSFLNPDSQVHFVDALKCYSAFTSKSAIKSAESLRRSLEEFLRHKLNNGYGLDRNIQELGKKLKADGRDAIIRNIAFQVFSSFDKYFNENSKHNDGDINEAENEFLIYQTGILMRYIDKNF